MSVMVLPQRVITHVKKERAFIPARSECEGGVGIVFSTLLSSLRLHYQVTTKMQAQRGKDSSQCSGVICGVAK